MAILLGLFGVIVGSFLNLVAYRLPRKKSIIFPSSTCTTCDTRIKKYDNIPIISWLLLHGRCRSCKSKISPRYLIGELGTGFLFALVSERFHSRSLLFLIGYFFLAAVSILLSLIDLDTQTLPNRILLPSFAFGAGILGIDGVINDSFGALVRALIAAMALSLFYLTLSVIYPGGMGMGDVKFAGLLGFFLGYLSWGAFLVSTFSTFFLGGIFAIALIFTKSANRKSGIPFGPWMALGSWLGIIFSPTILHHYYALFGLINPA